jgi:MFS family permease
LILYINSERNAFGCPRGTAIDAVSPRLTFENQTIITTALPTISEHFHSATGYTWIGSAYLLGAASSTPIWAKISDIFGRKPILLMANVVFFVGSLVAALSYSIGMLISARAVQGIGGGGLLTMVSVSIGDLFSMRTRGLYYGMVGFVWAGK